MDTLLSRRRPPRPPLTADGGSARRSRVAADWWRPIPSGYTVTGVATSRIGTCGAAHPPGWPHHDYTPTLIGARKEAGRGTMKRIPDSELDYPGDDGLYYHQGIPFTGVAYHTAAVWAA